MKNLKNSNKVANPQPECSRHPNLMVVARLVENLLKGEVNRLPAHPRREGVFGSISTLVSAPNHSFERPRSTTNWMGRGESDIQSKSLVVKIPLCLELRKSLADHEPIPVAPFRTKCKFCSCVTRGKNGSSNRRPSVMEGAEGQSRWYSFRHAVHLA